jgi:hypothetical protein
VPASRAKKVLFICQQAGGVDEDGYINEILSILDGDDVLYIKVHPRDDPARFSAYADDPRCEVIRHGHVDNYELISGVQYCFSVNSVLSVEAKHILENSFFINYDISRAGEVFDYDLAGDYLDIVTSREQLASVLGGEFRAKDKSLCYKGFNVSYPASRKSLWAFIGSILKNVEGAEYEK